jgi:hypothetical protein
MKIGMGIFSEKELRYMLTYVDAVKGLSDNEIEDLLKKSVSQIMSFLRENSPSKLDEIKITITLENPNAAPRLSGSRNDRSKQS